MKKRRLEKSKLTKLVKYRKWDNDTGCLLFCGPFSDDSGAMLVLQASSNSDAEDLIRSDPFIRETFYGDYSITEFYKADDANNYLMDHDQTLDELNRA